MSQKRAKEWLKNRKFKDVIHVDAQGQLGKTIPSTVICAKCDSIIESIISVEVNGDYYCPEHGKQFQSSEVE